MISAETTLDLTEYLEFVSPDVIRLRGHRLNIEHVLSYYLAGYQPDEIVNEFPGLELVKVYATIAYYLANQKQVSAYIYRKQHEDEQVYQVWSANPSPLIQRLRQIRDEQSSYKA